MVFSSFVPARYKYIGYRLGATVAYHENLPSFSATRNERGMHEVLMGIRPISMNRLPSGNIERHKSSGERSEAANPLTKSRLVVPTWAMLARMTKTRWTGSKWRQRSAQSSLRRGPVTMASQTSGPRLGCRAAASMIWAASAGGPSTVQGCDATRHWSSAKNLR
ncbi:hypothetical protein [Amycolatopsis sp. NPDC054798]